MKISLERLLAESSRLQDHRQRNCVIRSVIVESAVLSGRRVSQVTFAINETGQRGCSSKFWSDSVDEDVKVLACPRRMNKSGKNREGKS